jgi:hypothetical protein
MAAPKANTQLYPIIPNYTQLYPNRFLLLVNALLQSHYSSIKLSLSYFFGPLIMTFPNSADFPTFISQSTHIKMDASGRIRIPAEFRKRLGWEAESKDITIILDEHGMRIESIDEAIKKAQSIVKKYTQKNGVSLVDELLAERRQAFQNE